MHCDHAQTLLSAQLDGELAPDDHGALTAHLAGCADCRATAEAFRLHDAQARAAFVTRQAASANTAQRVLADLRRGGRIKPAQWRFAGLVAAAAAIVLLALWLAPSNSKVRLPLENVVSAASAPPGLGMTPRERPARTPAPKVTVGAMIETGTRDRRRVTLPDGSVAYIHERTSVTIVTERTLNLTAGEIYLEVEPAKTMFVVQSPTHTVEFDAARLAVRAESVTVTQGQVRVRGRTGVLTAGQELPATGPARPAPRASEQLAWTRDLMTAAEAALVPPSKHAGGALIAVDLNGQEMSLSLRKFHVDVHIEDGFARTTIDQTYFNHENRRMEGTFYFPLPPDASLNRLAMFVAESDVAKLNEGGMVERDEARNIYEQILTTQRDPALLEWVDGSTFKMRVFPLEARQEKRILLGFTQKLPSNYGQITYRFPAGHNLNVVDQWSTQVRVVGGATGSWHSPSHELRQQPHASDLVLTAELQRAKLDRDVVVQIAEHTPAQGSFATAQFEGHQYILARYRPMLDGLPEQPRRDWGILFETDGSRNPLLARTQVEIVRTLLEQTRPGDTFTLVTANTTGKVIGKPRQPVTPANIADALAALEATHLVGALDLAQALDVLRAHRPTTVVHVGSGVPILGQKDPGTLLKDWPGEYVGVGVGKRVNRAFWQMAAEQTGGTFVTINPDESIRWRTLELASVLNAPRLAQLQMAGGNLTWLPFSRSLTQGEEFAAIARVPAGARLPAHVSLTGTAGKQPFSVQLDCVPARTDAGYVPRLWAKLEIDRLLATGKDVKTEVVQLSKAMYVMSPFTSLLVLENDAMYTQFKVERGRKDHWAMYQTPNQIPVVHEPLQTAAAPAPPPVTGQPDVVQVLQSVGVRFSGTPYHLPAGWIKPGQCVVASQVWHESAWLPATRGKRNLNALGDMDTEKLRMYFRMITPDENGAEAFFGKSMAPQFQLRSLLQSGFPGPGDGRFSGVGFGGSGFGGNGLGIMGGFNGGGQFQGGGGFGGMPGGWGLNQPVLMGRPAPQARPMAQITNGVTTQWQWSEMDEKTARFRLYNELDLAQQRGLAPLGLMRLEDRFSDLPTDPEMHEFDILDAKKMPTIGGTIEAEVLARLREHRVSIQDETRLSARFLSDSRGERQLLRRKSLEESRKKLQIERHTWGQLPDALFGYNAQLLLQRPKLAENENFVRDLVALAAGLNTTDADVWTLLDTVKPTLGTVSPAAAALIAQARTARWEQLTLANGTLIQWDHADRVAIDRVNAVGMRELIRCDGTTLWHLYPDLGLASRRTMSRFHWAELRHGLPGAVPTLDELCRGWNLTALDEHTLECTPIVAGKTPIVERWTFANGKLHSRALFVDGKEVAKFTVGVPEKVTVQSSVAPADWLPGLDQLIVLGLPYRTPEHLQRIGWSKPGKKKFTDEQRAVLIASAFAFDNPGQLRDLLGKDETRPGWDVLLKAMPSQAVAASAISAPGPRELEKTAFAQQWSEFFTLYQYARPNTGADLNTALVRIGAFAERYPASALTQVLLDGIEQRWPDPATSTPHLRAAYVAVAAQTGSYADRYAAAVRAEPAVAERELTALYAEALKAGRLPPFERYGRGILEQKGAWQKLIRATAAEFRTQKAWLSLLLLSRQMRLLGDTLLAHEIVQDLLFAVPNDERPALTLYAAVELYLSGQTDAALKLLESVGNDEQAQAVRATAWRWAASGAFQQQRLPQAAGYLEQALAWEYRHLPAVIDVQMLRFDYGTLLAWYEQVARARQMLDVAAPPEFVADVIRTADRWRTLDPDPTAACMAAAKVLRVVGHKELTWQYLTTPMALNPNESAPVLSLAVQLKQTNQFELADQAYEWAFAAESTNPQILWDRAECLIQAGKPELARAQYQRIANGQWQPRFANLQHQARQRAGER
jgi:tetratricopeptide (TPR) repeat protein